MIAFLTAVGENIGPASRFVHYGLTSSDIGDTALSIQMIQAGKILVRGLDDLIAAIREKALNYKNTPCMGRSHGVHAEPTTFGMKMALYHAEFSRDRERLLRAIENVSYGKFSGAVGTFSNIDPDVELKECEKMGLKPGPHITR